MNKNLVLISISLFIISGCATTKTYSPRTPASAVPLDPGDTDLEDLTYFQTPEDGHQTFINAIKDARESIVMEMFHLTDPSVVDALKEISSAIKVTLILDNANASKGPGQVAATDLSKKSNFKIVKSSTKFKITHSKSMVVDGGTAYAQAYVTSINLTTAAQKTRDYGVMTHDGKIIDQLLAVFSEDVQNAANQTEVTPTIIENHLIFANAPSAKAKLLGLVLSAKDIKNSSQKFIYSTVENFVDTDIENAFASVAAEGVEVKIIVPMCDENPNSSLNFQPIVSINKKGVQGKMMPTAGTPEYPYMHGKMIVLGNGSAYIGSENFSPSSLLESRETGIIFTNSNVAGELIKTFKADWLKASKPAKCSKGS